MSTFLRDEGTGCPVLEWPGWIVVAATTALKRSRDYDVALTMALSQTGGSLLVGASDFNRLAQLKRQADPYILPGDRRVLESLVEELLGVVEGVNLSDPKNDPTTTPWRVSLQIGWLQERMEELTGRPFP